MQTKLKFSDFHPQNSSRMIKNREDVRNHTLNPSKMTGRKGRRSQEGNHHSCKRKERTKDQTRSVQQKQKLMLHLL
jgi:hypothetical protein